MDNWLDGQLVDQVVERMGLDSVKELDDDMNYKTLICVTSELFDIFEEENQDSDDPGGGDGGVLPDANLACPP